MNRSKPYLLSAISGFTWALIAYFISYSITGSSSSKLSQVVGGAAIVAPVIGILVGSVSRPFARVGAVRRISIALLDLYLAAFVFLWAAGLDPFRGVILGLTLTGYVFVLWPLSYANHLLVSRAWQQTVRRQSSAG